MTEGTPATRRGRVFAGLVFAIVLGLFPTAGIAARAEAETIEMGDAVGREVRIVGTVGMFGSVPFAFLGVLAEPDSDRDVATDRDIRMTMESETLFRIDFAGDTYTADKMCDLEKPTPDAAMSLQQSLAALQGRRIALTGVLTESAIGSGFPAVIVPTAYEVLD